MSISPPAFARASRAAWIVVALLWVVALLNYLDRLLVVNMSKPIKAELALDDSQFGMLSMGFLVVYGIFSPIAGYLADRFGSRPLILISLAIWSGATLWTGYVDTFEQMLMARIVMGVSEAFYMPAAVSLIVQFHRGATRSRATGLHLSGTYMGSILGGLGGWLAATHGWRWAFLVFGGMGLAYSLVLVFFLKSPDEEIETGVAEKGISPDWWTSLLAILQSRGMVLLLIMNGLEGAAFWMLRNWSPSFFQNELHIAQEYAGLYSTSVFHAAAFVGMLVAGYFSDKLVAGMPRIRTFIPGVGFALAAVAFVCLGWSSWIPVLIGAIMICGMAHGFLDANLMPAVCLQLDKRYWAMGYGMLNLVGTTVGGVMTYAGGRLKDAQVPFSSTFLVCAVFVFLTSMLLFVVRPRPSLEPARSE